MDSVPTVVEKRFWLSAERVDRLVRLARVHQVGEDQLVERALDILFTLTDLLDDRSEHLGWSSLSDASLQRIWDNEKDAAYDDWRELYGVPAR